MKWLTSNKRLTHMVRDISSTLYELMASGERRLRQNRWECKLLTCRTWWISVSFNSAIFSCLCFPHLHPSYTQHSDNLMLIITMSNPLYTQSHTCYTHPFPKLFSLITQRRVKSYFDHQNSCHPQEITLSLGYKKNLVIKWTLRLFKAMV